MIESGDLIDSIWGVSNQFRGGQMIIGEVFFEQPIALKELIPIAAANGSPAMAFHCTRGGLFQVEGQDFISGEGCVVVPATNREKGKTVVSLTPNLDRLGSPCWHALLRTWAKAGGG